MNIRETVFIAVLFALVSGCAHKVRNFQFYNKTDINIYADVYGFENPPPVGDLYPFPKGGSGATMGPMPLPKEAIMAWNEDLESHSNGFSHMQNLSLASLTNWSSDATLVFEFQSNRVWRVFCRPR
jgi:hypothetical protein